MEVKFKVWNKKDKQMIDWFTLTQNAWNTFRGDTPLSLIYDVLVARKDDFEVLPFIGVKDENNKEVHLADKVKGRYMVQRSLNPDAEPEIIHFEGVIKYAEGCFYVKAENGQCVFSFTYPDYELEVVGNEFEGVA